MRVPRRITLGAQVHGARDGVHRGDDEREESLPAHAAPDADVHSVGQENYDWIVENAANFAIEKALAHKDGRDNLTWGTYIRSAVTGSSMTPDVSDGGIANVPTPSATETANAPVKKTAPKKTEAVTDEAEKTEKKPAAKKTTKK